MKSNSLDSVGFVVSIDKGSVGNDTREEQMAKKTTNDSGAVSRSKPRLLSADRIALIRKRIAAGFYEQEDVLREVAGRIARREKDASSDKNLYDKSKP